MAAQSSMEVPLTSASPRPRSPTRWPSTPAAGGAAWPSPSPADPHSVQLSRYDGRLLLDRAVVPEDDGFADAADAERSGRIRGVQRLNHYAAAGAFLAVTSAYAASLVALGAGWDWGDHRWRWGFAVACQAAVLAAAFLLELVLKHVHRRHRADGHLQVYRRTKGLVRYPFRIASLTTAACMLVGAAPDAHRWLVRQGPLLSGIGIAQAAATTVWAAVYCTRVWHHNHGEGWPDAEADLAHGWSAWDHMGRRRGEQGSAQQAELIRYLHRQRDSLSQEVLRLHVLLERRGGEPPVQPEAQMHLSNAEAARHAEARALAAAELLRRENRSTWQMLDERQQTIQQLEESQQQQADENARLRRTLEEWSLANRKLEVEVGRWKQTAAQAATVAKSAAAAATVAAPTVEAEVPAAPD